MIFQNKIKFKTNYFKIKFQITTYEEDSNEFNSQLEDQKSIDNQNYYQMLVSIQRHDSHLLSEFNNAAIKTVESNEEEGEEDDHDHVVKSVQIA